MTPKPLITYIRVSTSRQGRSGLGIEAQRQVLAQFAQAEGFEVAREFVEVETGKGADAMDRRPQLKAALAAARKQRCHVAVAKLDRLSRDVHFISGPISAAARLAIWIASACITWFPRKCRCGMSDGLTGSRELSLNFGDGLAGQAAAVAG